MKRFLLRLLIFLSPILIIFIIYLCNDPYKVLFHYDSYCPKDGINYVETDRDFVSTETFKKNYPKYKYDSYIMGSSRSWYYRVENWSRHINSSKCYHFDASAESLFGVERKLNYLSKQHVAIKNVLLICDHELIAVTKNESGHVKVKSPDISGQKWLDFQAEFIKDFFDVRYLYKYLYFLFQNKNNPKSIDSKVFNTRMMHYEATTNEISFRVEDDEINKNMDSFYKSESEMFYKRDTVQLFSEPLIKEEQRLLFQNIKDIFAGQKTSYKIVISPLYDQKKLDSADLKYLQNLFGAENVYDFSGINILTNCIYNYYERSHYRPFIADRIMNIIYSPNSEDSMKSLFNK